MSGAGFWGLWGFDSIGTLVVCNGTNGSHRRIPRSPSPYPTENEGCYEAANVVDCRNRARCRERKWDAIRR